MQGASENLLTQHEGGERRIDVIEFIEIAEAIRFDPTDFIKEFVFSRARAA